MTAASPATQPGFLPALFRKLLRKLYFRRTLILFAHELADGHRKIKTSSRFVIRRFSDADFAACHPHFSAYVNDYAEFLKRGNVGFTAFSTTTGEAGGMAWCATETFTDVFYGCKIELKEGEVFQMAGEVAEPFRNSPLTANLQFAAWDYWTAQGKQRVLTLIQDDNAASMKFSMSAGYQETGKAILIHRLLGKRFYQYVTYSGERFAHLKKQNRHAVDTATSKAADTQADAR